MANEPVKNIFKNLPPGVTVPWDQKAKDIGEIKGDPEIIKKQWENIDVFAYLYLWWWVHR